MKISLNILFYGILFLCPLLLKSQYFNNRYPLVNYGGGIAFNSIENNNGYLMVGGLPATLSGKLEIVVIQTDFEGNVLFEKTYGDTIYSYYPGLWGSLRRLSDGGYIMYGTKQDTTRAYDLLYRLNNLGDILWTKQLGDSLVVNSFIGNNVKLALDGGFICIGVDYNVNNQIWLVKTDSLGNKQWEQHYGGAQYEFPTNVEVCSDGGYIFTGVSRNGGVGLPNGNIQVTKVDSLGNVVFDKYFGDVYDYDAGDNVIETQDGDYVVVGTYKTSVRVYPFILKLNSLGDSLWLNTYTPFSGNSNSNCFRSIVELNDGSFVAAGFNWFTDSVVIGRDHGLVIKTSAGGTPIWHKEYNNATTNTSSSLLYDIRTTSDGGFICTGTATAPQEMWLLKLDSMGCEDTTCYTPTLVEETSINNNTFQVYPNPNQGSFTISYSIDEQWADLQLISLTGQLVYRETLIENKGKIGVNTNLPVGIYLLTIKNSKSQLLYYNKVAVIN